MDICEEPVLSLAKIGSRQLSVEFHPKRTTSNQATASASISAAASTTVTGWSIAAARDTLGSVDRDELVRVLRAFEATRLEYVLIGATAMGFHGLVRATEDVDLFIRATPENIERLRQALRSAYADDPHIDDIRAFEGIHVSVAPPRALY